MMIGLGDCPAGQVADETGVCISTGAPSTGFDWSSWTAGLISGVSKTVENVIGQKNLAKGVYTQTSPTGTVTYVQPAGTSANIFGATSTGITGAATGSSGMGMILLAGAGLFLVFMLANKGKH